MIFCQCKRLLTKKKWSQKILFLIFHLIISFHLLLVSSFCYKERISFQPSIQSGKKFFQPQTFIVAAPSPVPSLLQLVLAFISGSQESKVNLPYQHLLLMSHEHHIPHTPYQNSSRMEKKKQKEEKKKK